MRAVNALIGELGEILNLLSEKSDFSRGDEKLTDELIEIFDSYLSAEDETRSRIRSLIPEQARIELLVASEKFAIRTFSENKESFAINGLICHSIENFILDPRENILRLSMIWYSCKKRKVDCDRVFKDVIRISSEPAGEHLREFLNRTEPMKSLNAMGLMAIEHENRLSFQPKPPPWQT